MYIIKFKNFSDGLSQISHLAINTLNIVEIARHRDSIVVTFTGHSRTIKLSQLADGELDRFLTHMSAKEMVSV
jgi:hypothetical protein